jgi:DNA replication protein DnaD
MPAGRPRSVAPTYEECIELGKDFVIWATEKTNEWRCLPSQWYSLKKGLQRCEWKILKQKLEFIPYYEQAMTALSIKAVDGTMESKFGQRYIRYFDQDLVEVENNDAIFNANLKNNTEEKSITINIKNYSDEEKKINCNGN